MGAAPVSDLDAIAERLRMALVHKHHGGGLDGAYLYLRKENVGVAMIDSEGTPGRQRFTGAHALAHHLLDRDRRQVIDRDLFASGAPVYEVRANAFAASFLLPAEGTDAYLEAYGADRREIRPEDAPCCKRRRNV